MTTAANSPNTKGLGSLEEPEIVLPPSRNDIVINTNAGYTYTLSDTFCQLRNNGCPHSVTGMRDAAGPSARVLCSAAGAGD